MAKTAFKLSTMVEGENFEMYSSQSAKSALKLSTMVGEIFEIYLSERGKSAFKFTMVRDIFEIYLSK